MMSQGQQINLDLLKKLSMVIGCDGLKFTFKTEFLYLVYLIIPFVISIVLLRLGKSVIVSWKESITMVSILYIPILIISLIVIFTTYGTIDDEGINIYYVGFFKKTISFDTIEKIEETEKGFNFFALANSKLKITSKGKNYIFSIKEKDIFLEKVGDYKSDVIKE